MKVAWPGPLLARKTFGRNRTASSKFAMDSCFICSVAMELNRDGHALDVLSAGACAVTVIFLDPFDRG